VVGVSYALYQVPSPASSMLYIKHFDGQLVNIIVCTVISVVISVGSQQVKPECTARDNCGSANSDMGRHWRVGKCET